MNPDESRVELYDIPADPSELNDLAPEHPQVVTRMSSELLAWQHSLPEGPVAAGAGRNDYPWPRSKIPLLQADALKLKGRELGAHLNDALSMNDLAVDLWHQRRFEEAEAPLIEMFQLCQQVLGNEHPDTLSAMNNLALLYLRQGRLAEAERWYIEILEVRRRALGRAHRKTVASMKRLARLYTRQARYEDAEPLLLEAYQSFEARFGLEHKLTVRVIKRLVSLYDSWGRATEAAEWRAKLSA